MRRCLLGIIDTCRWRQVKYGVIPAHYDVIGQALLKTLADGLGDAFTPEAKEAWTAVYGVVSSTMIGENY